MISDAKFYLKLLVRRLPVMILLFLICAIAGVVIAQRMPTMYRTSATLLVESAQISDDLVRSSVQVNTLEQLEVIQQRLLTRANLLDIANEVGVFPNARSMNPDTIVGQMRARTSIRRKSGRDRATLMTISFEGPNPRKVAAVVNQYVSLVQETNSDFRAGRTESTLAFFEQAVKTNSDNLDQQSAKIVAFKAKNSDALPDNLNYRLNRQSLLQERLARAERDQEALNAQRESIKRVYETTGTLQTARNVVLTPEQTQLRRLQSELRVALGVYSDTNPKVINLRTQIERLQTLIDASVPQSTEEEEGGTQTTALDVSLAEIDARVASLNQEIASTNQELEVLRDTIDRTPANGIALSAMERDLQNIQVLYSASVNRLNQAQMSERVELSGSGERITVLEAANVPTKPSSPNRPKIISMGVGVGLGLAGGLFFLLEVLNQAIRRPSDITKSLEITPLATVPRIETSGRRHWRRVAQIASLVAVLVGVPALLWAVDTYYMPLDLLFEKIRNRLV